MSTIKANRLENLTTTAGGININNSGRVGIGGVTSPFDMLHVKAGTDCNYSFSTVGGTEASLEIFNDAGTSNTPLNIRASAHKFKVQSTEICRVISDGLTFNGDTAAANALDDYEEGTWTPTMGFATSYGTRSGQYVKIGKTVHLHFSIQVTGWSTGTGSTRITGLPFNIDEVSGCWAGCINAAATTRDWRIGPWTAGPYGMGVWMENGQGSASSVGTRMSENTFSDYSSLTGSLGTSFTMRGGMTYISTT